MQKMLKRSCVTKFASIRRWIDGYGFDRVQAAVTARGKTLVVK